jgi:hypothetical protein
MDFYFGIRVWKLSGAWSYMDVGSYFKRVGDSQKSSGGQARRGILTPAGVKINFEIQNLTHMPYIFGMLRTCTFTKNR